VTDPNNVLCFRAHFRTVWRLSQLPNSQAGGYLTPTSLSSHCVSKLLCNECESYVTTDGQSASLSWYKAPIWGLRPDLYYCLTVAGLLMCGALSDERRGLSFTTAAGPRQRSHSRVRVPWDSQPYFTVSDSRLPFSSPPTTRRVTVEVFDPASKRETPSSVMTVDLCYIASARSAQRTRLPIALLLLCACLLRPLPSNNRCLQSHYLATVVV
jgi:hypothetical protein